MKSNLIYLAAFSLMFWACGDSSSSIEPMIIPEHGSSAVESFYVETSSSAEDIFIDTACCNTSSSVSSAETALSSSSYSRLSEYAVDSTRIDIFRFLYPLADGTLDTGYFDEGECRFDSSGTFNCRQGQCWPDIGGHIHLPISVGMMAITVSQKDEPKYSEFFHQSTEMTRLVDINFGDSALTNYIPYADITDFDTDDALKRLSILPAATCTTLEHFIGNYRLTAEGLPEGIILYNDGEGIKKSWTEPSTEPYSKLIPKDEISTTSINMPPVSVYGLVGELPSEFASEREYAENMDYDYKDLEFNVLGNEYGCGVISCTYYKEYIAGRCEGWTIPEKKKVYSARLLNISDKVPTEPIHWKLIYRDQFGRGGSLDVTTSFE